MSAATRHGEKQSGDFLCHICATKFRHSSSFSRHWAMQHSNKRKPQKEFPCPRCPYIGSNRVQARRHERNHNPSSLLPCEYCPYKARDRSRLKRHQRAVHKAKKGEKKILVITLYTCCICATEFSRERDLTRHIKSYHPYGV